MELIINIPDPADMRLGYLSNASLYSFVINKQRWLSVDHFLIAKRFEGTKEWDDIRLAKNMAKVRTLCRPKRVTDIDEDGRISRRFVFGSSLNTNKYLYEALRAKFDQNNSIRKRLLDTKGTTILDSTDISNTTGIELMKVRDEYIIKMTTGSKSLFPLSDALKDIKFEELTQEMKDILDGIIRIALMVKDKEGLDKIYPEMFEDALYNIGLGEISYAGLISWIEEMTKDWSNVMTKTPKFYVMFKSVEKYISSKKLSEYNEKEYISTALLLSAFIKWYQSEGSGATGKTVVSNIFILRPNHITIPAKPRKYRNTIPGKVHPKIQNEGGITFKDQYGDIIVITGNTMERIILRIDVMETYRPQIIAAGGKITSSTTVEFHNSKLSIVEDMIYTSLQSTEDKYDMICRSWARRRISLVDDVRTSLLTHKEKPLVDTARILGLKFIPIGTSPPEYILSELKERNMPTVLSRKLCHHFVPAEKDKLIPLIESGSTKTDIMKTMDLLCGWRCTDIRKIDIGILVCCTMKNILSCFPESIENLLSEKTWAFTMTIPLDLREKALAYTKTHLTKFKEFSGSADANASATLFSSSYMPVPATISSDIAYVIAYSFISDYIKKGLSTGRIIERCKLFGFVSPENLVIREKVDKKIVSSLPEPQEPPKIGTVIECEGSLMSFTDAKWVCVVANVTSLTIPKKPGTRSEIITRSVYEKYIYSNIYTAPDRKGAYTPGDVIISIPRDSKSGIQLSSTVDHRYVATLFAEFASGGPKKITDTKHARFDWFSSALDKLYMEMKNGDTLAFSTDTLMEGYRDSLIALSKKVGVTIYILSGSVPMDVKISRKTPVENIDMSYTGNVPEKYFTAGDMKDEISRGVLYIKLFKGFVPSDQYSKVVSAMEKMQPGKRKIWLTDYTLTKETDKKNMLLSLIL